MATIFIRQHAIMDIITGVAISACAAMFIVDHFKFDVCLSKLFDRLHTNISKTHIRFKTNREMAFIGWASL
jgi:hypothetical protein